MRTITAILEPQADDSHTSRLLKGRLATRFNRASLRT